MKFFPVMLAGLLAVLLSAGCRTYTGDFVEKTPEELAEMERQSRQAHKCFVNRDYETAEKLLRGLMKERTVNLLLYNQELASVLLMRNKHQEALSCLLQQHLDWDYLFNPDLKDAARNLWHNSSDIYISPDYERSLFYLLMALASLNEGRYDDALRCVKYGIAVYSDKNAYSSQQAFNDYNSKDSRGCALLYYLGYLSAGRSGSKESAEIFWQKMLETVSGRGAPQYKPGSDLQCYNHLRDLQANVLLVLWSGLPPVVMDDLVSGDKVVVRGSNPWDMLSVAVDGQETFFFPPHLCNIDLLAVEQGRKDEQDIKSPDEVINNPEKHYRYWQNLPGMISVLPLRLAPGKHKVFFAGHDRSDRSTMKMYDINVTAGNINVINLPMLENKKNVSAIREKYWETEWQIVLDQAEQNRLSLEIK